MTYRCPEKSTFIRELPLCRLGGVREVDRNSVLLACPPPPLSCAKGEKEFRKVLATAAKHHIPAGYRKDFCGHRIPEAVRSLIEESDSCRVNDLRDPRVKILDNLIQRGIRQEAQDQWQSLLDRSDRRTNPTRYWSLLHKLSGKRAPQPPNICISFVSSPLSSAKTLAKAFTKQFTAVAVPGAQAPDGGGQCPDRTRRKLLRHIHWDHQVDQDFRPFSVRDIEQAIRETSQSTAVGPDGLTVAHLKHLGASGLAFLTELRWTKQL